MEYVTRSGVEVPAVGLGTWQLGTAAAYDCVSTALEAGYRHVDTAQAYGNEAGVGRAIADSDVPREEIFLTTKVDGRNRSVEAIVASMEDSVDRLGTPADLALVHWPNPLASVETVMRGLNEARDRGLTRHVGVSNFGVERLDRARAASDAPVLTDQVLFHPWWPQRELLRYCQDEGVVLTAYSPLGRGAAVGDDLLAKIGARYGKTAAQVAIRWATQHDGVAAIPKSSSRDHIEQNLAVFDFRLTREEHDSVTRPSYLKTGLAMVRGHLGV
ncbi:MAG: aldo/keto reductase [Halobacteriaceae archaeon]